MFHSIGGIVSLVLLISALITIMNEAKKLPAILSTKTNTTEKFLQGLVIFLGGLITFALSHDLGLGPVIATSMIALLVCMIMTKYSVAA